MNSLYIFDLDGTLTKSKQQISEEMGDTLSILQQNGKVAIISGCSWSQFQKQVIPFLKYTEDIILMPTCGASMYVKKQGVWEKEGPDNSLSFEEKVNIYNAWKLSIYSLETFDKVYGDRAEDRGEQITFSMMGQEAPYEVKKYYDPDGNLRASIVEHMKKMLPGYEIRTGGTTSIDVTKKGIDKAYGVDVLEEYTGIDKGHMVFVGDALFAGGNDEVVKKTGVRCISTSGYKETLKIIQGFVEEKANAII